MLGGSLTFGAPSQVITASEFEVPVTVSGEIEGYNVTQYDGLYVLGQPLWTIDVSGTGEGTFYFDLAGIDVADEVDYSFSSTPEPNTFILFFGSIAGLAFVLRRKLLA